MNQPIHWAKIIILLVAIFSTAALSFFLGTKSKQIERVELVDPVGMPTNSDPQETAPPAVTYKNAFLNGEIPRDWSEYWNGYLTDPINDKEVIKEGGVRYSQNLFASIGEGAIAVSDIPYNRLDIFTVTPSVKESLVNDWKKQGTYSQTKIGDNLFDTITFKQIESDEYSQGEVFRAYFLPLNDSNEGAPSEALMYELGASQKFDESVQHYLSTISSGE